LAYVLAEYKSKNVLVVDVDPQFNASLCLLGYDDYKEKVSNKKSKGTIVDLFEDAKKEYPGIAKKHKIKTNLSLSNLIRKVVKNTGQLDLIPSRLNLIDIERSPRGTENKLKNYLNKIKGKYDYILIDCPPTASIYSLSALIASDLFLIPVKTDYLSSIGIPLLEKWIMAQKETYALSVKRLGLIFTMVHKTHTMDKEIMASIKKNYKKYVFKGYIKETTRIKRGVVEIGRMLKSHEDIEKQLLNISSEFIKRMEARA
jgi:chromosome partitioning protein